MQYADYTVRRLAWPVWRWQANYYDEVAGGGYAFSRASARRAARSWLRLQRRFNQATAPELAPVDSSRLAAE